MADNQHFGKAIFLRWATLTSGQKRFVTASGSFCCFIFLAAAWLGTTLGSAGTYDPPFPWALGALLQQVVWFGVVLGLEINARKQ